jgi:hypothetical protein
MNEARKHFLAGSALAEQQNRYVEARRTLDAGSDGLHGLGPAEVSFDGWQIDPVGQLHGF